MTIVKPNLSSLVQSQLPEFIQEDYQTFAAFLEAYYQFLEQNYNKDYDTLLDVDTTLDSFVQYFKNELALNFPATLVNERFLMQHIKELYVSKGTEPSYRLLFRLLYGKEIDVKYPSTQVLRASSGNWIRPTSVFINVTQGDPNVLIGNYVYIYSYLSSTQTTNKIRILVESCTLRSGTIYELGISNNYIGSFNVGDKIITSTFTGDLVSTTSKITIISGGSGFKQGQIFEVSGSSSKSKILIKRIDQNGAIKTAVFIYFGTGYSSDSTLTLTSPTSVTATLSIQLGAVASYPGYYADNTGFISDNIYIQDSRYYQDFSYTIVVDELFDSYKSVFKNLVHPTGHVLFGEYYINNSFDSNISTNSISIIKSSS